MAEIVAELGSPVAVADALDTLQAFGLVGLAGALVFVTPLAETRRSSAQRHLCDTERL